MHKYFNKNVPTPIAISIPMVLIVALIGMIAWQYLERPEFFVAKSINELYLGEYGLQMC